MSSNIVRDQEHFSYPSCMKYLVGTFLIYWWPIVPFQVTRTLLQLRGEYIIYLFLLLSLMLFVFFLFVIIFFSSLHRFLFHSFIDHTSCYSIDGNALSFLFFFVFLSFERDRRSVCDLCYRSTHCFGKSSQQKLYRVLIYENTKI